MKERVILSLLSTTIFFAAVGNYPAQDFKDGVVKYQQTTNYNWRSIFGLEDNTDVDITTWLMDLPTERLQAKVLRFVENAALYEKDPSVKEVYNQKLEQALLKVNYMKPTNIGSRNEL